MKLFKEKYKKYGKIFELVIAIILTIILLSGHIAMVIDSESQFSDLINNPYLGLIIATIVQFFIGRKFYVLMYREIFSWHRLGMNTLIGVSSLSAYILSLFMLIYNVINNQNMTHHEGFMYFFEVGTTIITFLLIGETISKNLRKKVNQDMSKVLEIQVSHALKYDLNTKLTIEINTKNLIIGDYVLIQPQTRVPADCKIIENNSYFDESLITGESMQVFHDVGDKLIGGTTNLTNTIIAQIIKSPNETIVSSILKRIKKIQSSQLEIQKIVDKIALWFVPIVLALGIISFFIHMFFGYQIQQVLNINSELIPKFIDPNTSNALSHNARIAAYFAIGLIAISCPCALGLATPLAIVVGVGKAARLGIVYNNVEIFEKTKKINMVAFDKTGTLTQNNLIIEKVFGNENLFPIIMSLVQNATHPLSKKLYEYLKNRNFVPINLTDFKEIPGIGLQGFYQNQFVEISSYNNFLKNNYEIDQNLDINKIQINTNICFSIDKKICVAFIVNDTLKPNADMVIKLLHNEGIDVCLISGDNVHVVEKIAKQLNILHYFGNCSAFKKEKIIKKFQDQGYKVAFAGDGINDLIALKISDLSINVSLINESANSVSDVSVVNQDIMNVYNAIVISKKTRWLIISNLLSAFLYNIIAIPLAFLGIVPIILAVLLMSFSDFALVLNTLIFSTIEFKPNKKIKKFNQINLRDRISI